MNPKEWTFTAVFLFLSFPLFSLFRFLFSSWEKGCTLFLHESVPLLPSFFPFSLKTIKQVWSLKTNEGNERRDTKRATDIIIIKIISFLCLFFPSTHLPLHSWRSVFSLFLLLKNKDFLSLLCLPRSPLYFSHNEEANIGADDRKRRETWCSLECLSCLLSSCFSLCKTVSSILSPSL